MKKVTRVLLESREVTEYGFWFRYTLTKKFTPGGEEKAVEAGEVWVSLEQLEEYVSDCKSSDQAPWYEDREKAAFQQMGWLHGESNWMYVDIVTEWLAEVEGKPQEPKNYVVEWKGT